MQKEVSIHVTQKKCFHLNFGLFDFNKRVETGHDFMYTRNYAKKKNGNRLDHFTQEFT